MHRNRQRIRGQVAHMAFWAETRRSSARNTNIPFKGRTQKRNTYYLQIITFGLQRAAGQ
jgi:hypothetical protein